MIEPGNSLRVEAFDNDDRIVIHPNGDEALSRQLLVLIEALRVYDARNAKYKDNWRRFGWRGCLFRLRERVERAWDYLWNAEPFSSMSPEPDTDDLIDLINFAAFTVRAVRDGNRDGSWWGT